MGAPAGTHPTRVFVFPFPFPIRVPTGLVDWGRPESAWTVTRATFRVRRRASLTNAARAGVVTRVGVTANKVHPVWPTPWGRFSPRVTHRGRACEPPRGRKVPCELARKAYRKGYTYHPKLKGKKKSGLLHGGAHPRPGKAAPPVNLVFSSLFSAKPTGTPNGRSPRVGGPPGHPKQRSNHPGNSTVPPSPESVTNYR